MRQHKRNRYKKVQAAPTVNNALGRYSFYSLKSNVALSAQSGRTASRTGGGGGGAGWIKNILGPGHGTDGREDFRAVGTQQLLCGATECNHTA